MAVWCQVAGVLLLMKKEKGLIQNVDQDACV